MRRDVSLAKYRANSSAEARERVRLAMAAHNEAVAKRPKSKQLEARQARLPFPRTARADFAMNDYLEALDNR